MWALFILMVTTTYARILSESKYSLRVYNGVDADTAKYPFVVALKPEMDPDHLVPRLCTGALITETWVLSAADCLTDSVKYVQYGNLSIPLGNTEDKSSVVKMIRHPRYFPASYVNNIGLVQVKAVPMAKYGGLSAVDYVTMLGHPVEYAGFGMTFVAKRKTKNKKKTLLNDMQRPLQIGEGAVKSCSEPFSKSFICLSSKCSLKQHILHGDSGAPLFCGGKIIAIACTFLLDQYEQIFTPISPYLTWIYQVVNTQGE